MFAEQVDKVKEQWSDMWPALGLLVKKIGIYPCNGHWFRFPEHRPSYIKELKQYRVSLCY